MTKATKILIVEDERLIAEDLCQMLSGMGYGITGIFDTGEGAITCASEQNPDLILMDINLSGEMDGITASERIKAKHDIPIIFLTAFATDAVVERAKLIKPSGYILKPYSEAQIRTSIEIAKYNHMLECQIKERNATIQMLVNSTNNTLMLLDTTGVVQYVNKALANTIGREPEAIVGMQISQLKDEGFFSQSVIDQLSIVTAGEAVHIEEQLDEKWIEYTLTPVLDNAGTVSRIGLFSHDITFRKNVELGLHTKVDSLLKERESLRRAKDDLFEINDYLLAHTRARSAEFAGIQKRMEQNQILLSLINAGELALLEQQDEPTFLRNICDLIVNEKKYSDAWVISQGESGHPVHMAMSNNTYPDLTSFMDSDGTLMFCPRLGLSDVHLLNAGDDICTSCSLSEIRANKKVIISPIKNNETVLGVAGVLMNSEEILLDNDEISAFKEICNGLGFAVNYFRSGQREKQAFQQISKNIEILSTLNDVIRNPLSIIMGMIELDEENAHNVILEQVRKIDKIIDDLDGGFLESMKVFNYLKKHHGLET